MCSTLSMLARTVFYHIWGTSNDCADASSRGEFDRLQSYVTSLPNAPRLQFCVVPEVAISFVFEVITHCFTIRGEQCPALDCFQPHTAYPERFPPKHAVNLAELRHLSLQEQHLAPEMEMGDAIVYLSGWIARDRLWCVGSSALPIQLPKHIRSLTLQELFLATEMDMGDFIRHAMWGGTSEGQSWSALPAAQPGVQPHTAAQHTVASSIHPTPLLPQADRLSQLAAPPQAVPTAGAELVRPATQLEQQLAWTQLASVQSTCPTLPVVEEWGGVPWSQLPATHVQPRQEQLKPPPRHVQTVPTLERAPQHEGSALSTQAYC